MVPVKREKAGADVGGRSPPRPESTGEGGDSRQCSLMDLNSERCYQVVTSPRYLLVSHISRAKPAVPLKSAEAPPRDRILAAARELFYGRGIRAVSVDEIAAAAGTNKMTLYRHFESKDRLLEEAVDQSDRVFYARLTEGQARRNRASDKLVHLIELAAEMDSFWQELAHTYRDNPRAQLEFWLKQLCEGMSDPGNRGCALANAAHDMRRPGNLKLTEMAVSHATSPRPGQDRIGGHDRSPQRLSCCGFRLLQLSLG